MRWTKWIPLACYSPFGNHDCLIMARRHKRTGLLQFRTVEMAKNTRGESIARGLQGHLKITVQWDELLKTRPDHDPTRQGYAPGARADCRLYLRRLAAWFLKF